MSGTRIPAASCPDCGQILLIVIGEPDVAEWAEKVLLHQCPGQGTPPPAEPAPAPAELAWLATEPSNGTGQTWRTVVRWALVAAAVLVFVVLLAGAERRAQPVDLPPGDGVRATVGPAVSPPPGTTLLEVP